MATIVSPVPPPKSLDDYKAELDRLSINFAAIIDQPLIMPKQHKVMPHHWRWQDLHRMLWQSLTFQDKLPTGHAGAERRIIRLKNPGIPDETVTNTMSMSVQLLLPGEVARPHRHTPIAFRFFLEGSAYTTVEGEKCQMEPGDLVLTPYMTWHDHGNDSAKPAIWIDGLDFPLVRFLDAVVKQDTNVPKQETNMTGTSTRRFGRVGVKPAWISGSDVARSSLIHYRWRDTEAALNALAEAGDADSCDDVIVEYINPATGNAVFTTLTCYMQMIRPGITTQEHRLTGHKVFHAFAGSGQTVVDGRVIEWSKGDFFIIPSLAWHHHRNVSRDPAILFCLTDSQTLRHLGLYWEEKRPAQH